MSIPGRGSMRDGGQIVAFVGARAAGKTTLARALAERLGWPVVDTDAELAARTGESVADLLRGRGEPAFRALEEPVCLEALSPEERPSGVSTELPTPPEPATAAPVPAAGRVVALGGGAVLSAAVRDALVRPGVLTVLLEAPPECLLQRQVDAGSQRPPLTTLPPADEVRALLDARRAQYEKVASVRISTFSSNVDACVELVLAKMDHDRQDHHY